MSDKYVPTEVQRLKLQLALRECDIVNAKRDQMGTELRLYQMARLMADTGLQIAQAEDARLSAEQERLVQRICELRADTGRERLAGGSVLRRMGRRIYVCSNCRAGQRSGRR